MAPFDSPYSSNLTNKISPLLEGQVPDFIQADHPVFVKFLKSYFEYLEAGELRVSVVIDNLLLELETESFVLDSDDNKVVLEDGTDATTGKFVVGETITGATSKATATILVDDLGNSTKPRLFITGQQQFQTGETITGGTSGSIGTVVRYRANPVQNLQQLLEYANVDNTIYDFLDQLRDSFMNAIPKELAAGVNKRNLIKNIRELYRAKGTSEGHKIFMRMLLDENIEVIYPNQYMMRVSDGDWGYQTIIRCSPGVNAIGDEIIGVVITGQTSGATAVVSNALSTAEGGDAITEFEINPASLSGTFVDGEIIQATSTVQDVTMSFTVRGIVTSYAVTDGGKLYSVGDDLNLDTQTAIGNGEALAEVGSIKTGSVSRVVVDDVGANYRVGDILTFTATESGTTTKAATGFVSVVDGSLAIDGTDSSSSDAGDNLVLESGSTSAFIEFDIGLEDETGVLLLDRTTVGGANAGEKIIVEPATDIQFTLDTYGTDSDTFALESGTVATGEIVRVFLKDGGEGYSLLPSVAVTSTNGASAVLTADTNDIGAVDSVNITKQGFKYTEAPEGQFIANFLLKDVTGTFGVTNTLASSGHTGVVKGFNSTTKVLKTTFEDVQRITMETGSFEGIELEQNSGDNDHVSAFIINTGVLSEGSTLLEDSTAGVSRKLLLDASAEVAIDQLVLNGTDGSSTNAGERILLEGVQRPGFERGFITEAMGDANVSQAENAAAITRRVAHKITLEDSPDIGESVIVSEKGIPIVLETSPQVIPSGFDNHSPLTQIDSRNRGLFATVEDEGENLLIDGFENLETYDFLILDGTDSVGTNSGERLINESSNENNNQILIDGTDAAEATVNGAVSKTNIIIVDGVSGTIATNMIVTVKSGATSISDGGGVTDISTNDTLKIISVESQTKFEVSESVTIANDVILSLQTDASGVLLNDIETASGSIALNGTDSSSTHAGDNIVNEQPPDFSAEGTTITDSGGASGTIISVDIAKGTTSIGTKAETVASYGTSIESLIGEDLNRIQDSVYYQQFSYEIETASSQSDYLTELLKAVHPAGFNIFGKVSIASLVSAAIPNAGASLGGGFTSNFSPILASTFTVLFSEEVSRATGVMEYGVNNFDDEILLETDNFTPIGTKFLVENEEGGDDEIILEDFHNPTVFAGDVLSLENGFGQIIVEESLSNAEIGNRIISETGVEVTHDLLLEPEGTVDGGNLFPGETRSKTYFLLDGTDSSSSNTGDRFISEDAPSAKLLAEPIGDTNSLLNEDGGNQYLETAGKGDVTNKEISVISRVITKINLPNKNSSSLPTGLITMAESPFGYAPSKIDLEFGQVGSTGSGNLTLVGFEQINLLGGVDRVTGSNENLVFEDAVDENTGTGFVFSDFAEYKFNTMVLDGTDSSGSNAGDQISLENETKIASSDPNSSLTGDGALVTGNILLDGSGFDVGVKLEDGTDTNNGALLLESDNGNLFSSNEESGKILNETATLQNTNSGFASNHVQSFVSIEDIIRQQRFVGDPDGGREVNIILEHFGAEGSESIADLDTGSIELEDSLLINSKGYIVNEIAGIGNTISLESNPDHLVPEDIIRTTIANGFDDGIIPEENFTKSNIEPYSYSSDIVSRPIGALVLEDLGKEATNILLESSGTEGLDMAQESGVAARTAPDTGINLESTLGDKLLLNGTDGSGTNDGENLKTERTFEALSNLVYDATGIDADDNVINENSTIGIDGYNLGTFQGGANFLLDRTAASGNFTNVGEQVILETATFYNIISDPITGAKLSIPQTFENSFDSTLSTFDSSTKTFDSTL